jgi:hypothetical protein
MTHRWPLASAAPVALIAAGVAAWFTWAADPPMAVPDGRLTPGDVATSDPAVICHPGYSRSQRVYETQGPAVYGELREIILERYGGVDVPRSPYELDDRIPLCLGGRQSALNLWPQLIAEARIKDQIEIRACRLACKVGTREAIEAWQAKFRGDWRKIR